MRNTAEFPLTGEEAARVVEDQVKVLEECRRLRAERDVLAYAVWMVGNMDTELDKDAWWDQNDAAWQCAAEIVRGMAERGVTMNAGFKATRLSLEPQQPIGDMRPLALREVAGFLRALAATFDDIQSSKKREIR